MKNKLLVIEAHSDDSAISIGGFLEKFRHKYDYHFVVAAVSGVNLHHSGMISRENRLYEYQQYIDYFGGKWEKIENLPFDQDSKLDTIPIKELIIAIEKCIDFVKPKVLICQGPSFHQDHTLVYEATIAATRPTALFCPDEIYIMENPTYVHSLGPTTDFKPDLYCVLTPEELEKKLTCFRECFPSQIREESNYLSIEGIRSWARYRGIEAGCMYAEALQTYIRRI